MEVELRAATAQDAAALLELWQTADAHPSVTDDVGTVRGIIIRDPEGVIIAVHGSAIIGSIMALSDGWRGNMYRLAVHPDFRRQGIAGRLVEAGEQHLREIGEKRVSALVIQTPEAKAFWASAGYERSDHVGRHAKGL